MLFWHRWAHGDDLCPVCDSESAQYILGGKVGVKLLRLVSEWAKSQDAEEIHIHSTLGIEPERIDKMLTRVEFKTYGGNYVAMLAL